MLAGPVRTKASAAARAAGDRPHIARAVAAHRETPSRRARKAHYHDHCDERPTRTGAHGRRHGSGRVSTGSGRGTGSPMVSRS
jgi:hypothetical protein